MREFQALCSFHLLSDSLRAFLLSPATQPGRGVTAGQSLLSQAAVTAPAASVMEALETGGVPAPMRELLAKQYNVSQLAAISSVLHPSSRFSLVQGPPGTGKTSAILAIASVLLAGCTTGNTGSTGDKTDEAGPHKDGAPGGGKAVQPQYKKPAAAKRRAAQTKVGGAPSDKGTHTNGGGEGDGVGGEGCEGPLKLGTTPPVRILICAQSNAAIDELVARLSKEMVLRRDGARRWVFGGGGGGLCLHDPCLHDTALLTVHGEFCMV